MKKFSFLIVLLACFTIFLISCKKENTQVQPIIDGEFSKTLELFDESGKNKIDIVVSSDQECLLEKFNSKSMKLITLLKLPEVNENSIEQETINENNSNILDSGKIPIYIDIVGKKIDSNILGWELLFDVPANNHKSGYCHDFNGDYNVMTDWVPSGWFNKHKVSITSLSSNCIGAKFQEVEYDGGGGWQPSCGGYGGYNLCNTKYQSCTTYGKYVRVRGMAKTGSNYKYKLCYY